MCMTLNIVASTRREDSWSAHQAWGLGQKGILTWLFLSSLQDLSAHSSLCFPSLLFSLSSLRRGNKSVWPKLAGVSTNTYKRLLLCHLCLYSLTWASFSGWTCLPLPKSQAWLFYFPLFLQGPVDDYTPFRRWLCLVYFDRKVVWRLCLAYSKLG